MDRLLSDLNIPEVKSVDKVLESINISHVETQERYVVLKLWLLQKITLSS